MGSLEKQFGWGLLSLPGPLDIGPTLPIPPLLFSLPKTLRGEAGTERRSRALPGEAAQAFSSFDPGGESRVGGQAEAPVQPGCFALQRCCGDMLPPAGHTGKTQPRVFTLVCRWSGDWGPQRTCVPPIHNDFQTAWGDKSRTAWHSNVC